MISDERLNKFIKNPSDYGPAVLDMAKEILAHRAAKDHEVYQERRYHFIGKKQLEYWADIEKGSYQYLPESERRIIHVLAQ